MPEAQGTGSKKFGVGFILFSVLFTAWLVPPLYRGIQGICPMRPGLIKEAGAVPGFARKYGLSCSQCHTAWPLLNDYGRQFKLNGYVREPGSKEGVLEGSGGYWTEKIFPWGVVARSRPYDKNTTVDREFRFQPIQDADFFVAGGDAAKHISWFGEVDANNTTDTAFSVNMADIQAGYHPSQYLNIIAARRGFFVMDPYQNISNFGSPTITGRAIAGGQTDQGNLSGNVMDQTTQTMLAFGEVDKEGLGALYYAAGMSAGNANDTGTSAKAGNLRLAYDTLKGLEIGAFGSSGREYNGLVDQNGNQDRVKFTKYGLDYTLEAKGFVSRGACLVSNEKDEQLANSTVEVDENGNPVIKSTTKAAYAELLYVYKRQGDTFPFLVPLVRENWYTTFNGKRSFNYVTAQLAHYFAPNMKGFVEWSGDTKQDLQGVNNVSSAKSSRWSLQFELGF